MITEIDLECNHCKTIFPKVKAEYTRQTKRGRKNWYCCRSCAGKDCKREHLKEWCNSSENKAHIASLSGNKGDEFTGFRGYLARIRKRIIEGVNFDGTTDITLEYLKELWEDQNGKCAYTNVDLQHQTYKNREISKNYQGSVDRIDSTKGYIKGNIQFVSVTVNWLKNNQPASHVDEFFDIVRSRIAV